MGNILLRSPSEVLARFSLDMLAVPASQLREISGPVATPTGNFSTNVGSLRRYYFTFFFYFRQYCGQVIYIYCVIRRCYNSIRQMATPFSSLQSLACLCITNFQLADGANPGQDYLGSTDESLGPGGNSSADNGTSMSRLLPVLCSVIILFAAWVVRKWSEFLPPAATMEGVDYAALGSAFDRISSENNCLRQEVSSLNCELSELFSVVGRLREDLDGRTADQDSLSERAGWQHAGMVRLGGFNPHQSLSIQQRQQVFARERRNTMACRAMGPAGSCPRLFTKTGCWVCKTTSM